MAHPDGPDLSSLPRVDDVLALPGAREAADAHGHEVVRAAVRDALDGARTDLRAGARTDVPDATAVLAAAAARLDAATATRLRPVLNATGVVLHTNLGRAPLSGVAVAAAVDAAGATTLEYDVATGTRGSRTRSLGELAARACGAEAATVVNNGAGALMLVLAALAAGRGTIVSRGELIEIGGSYRLPDVMAAAGTRTVEVGTTNRTRTADHAAAIDDDTALLLKVHPSNYRVVGFTEEAPAAELAALARDRGLAFVHDVGSGLLRPPADPALARLLADEPTVSGALAAGADLVLFSGDKLLGGPQAGVVAGRADLVAACTRHPLARALRIDKLQRAALEATLAAHLRDPGDPDLPVWRMLRADPADLATRAAAVLDRLDGAGGVPDGASVTAVGCEAVVGGGSLPGATLPSHGLAVVPADGDADGLAARLRGAGPDGPGAPAVAVVGRVEDGRVVLDLRTVPPDRDGDLTDALVAALAAVLRGG
ncbi:MAG: L-seryl-tRNA(Sec) selenium transferase [Actinomycetes bacterium]